MTTYTIEDYLAIAELELLEVGGVDNWTWYGDALEDYNEESDEAANAHEMLRCLENAGVDNWEWYGESITGLDDYEDYVREVFASTSEPTIENVEAWLERREIEAANAPVEEEPIVESLPEPFELKDDAERMLFAALASHFPERSDVEIDSLVELFRGSSFWKRNTFPKLMTRAFEETPPDQELPASYKNHDTYFNRVRATYVILVLSSGKFEKFLKDFMANLPAKA